MNQMQAQRLRAAADTLEDQPMRLQQLFRLHGRGGPGALLVVLTVPCLLPLPGAGTLMSMGLAALAWMIWRYFPRLVMPRRVGRLQLSAPMARRALHTLAWLYEQAARVMRARLRWWVQPGHRVWLAPLVAAMALVIFLPIPFGNVVPAVALLLIGLGLVFEDGLALLAGAALGFLLVITLAVLAVSGAQWLPQVWAAWQA
ncbi:exopolysaccharide biosynthesis protein [Rhodoferax sp.]|uniref:exopolysaccharide biosynthesis protein n=1 Tax=Rhodoferax sp. TaxID=50421 RepID=UPI002ACDBCF6|nr:exopolysaccharide biosynthesis protein [Rhodoferax sp.]MDZ7921852.1 exopolysaccharide biosynthesis protein [Rhodoferax sp.]